MVADPRGHGDDKLKHSLHRPASVCSQAVCNGVLIRVRFARGLWEFQGMVEDHVFRVCAPMRKAQNTNTRKFKVRMTISVPTDDWPLCHAVVDTRAMHLEAAQCMRALQRVVA